MTAFIHGVEPEKYTKTEKTRLFSKSLSLCGINLIARFTFGQSASPIEHIKLMDALSVRKGIGIL